MLQPSSPVMRERRNSILDFLSHKLAGRPCSAPLIKLSHGVRRAKSTDALGTHRPSTSNNNQPTIQRFRSESIHVHHPVGRPLPPHCYIYTPRSETKPKLISERVLSRTDIAMIQTTSFDEMIRKGFSSPLSSPSVPPTPTSATLDSSWLLNSDDSDLYQPTLKLTLTPAITQSLPEFPEDQFYPIQ